MLHNNSEIFEETIVKASEYLGINVEIIEKDYYVTLFLKELVKAMPDIVFKGGTSLSKCYHIIKRFSEDIDLNVQSEKKPTESKRKQMKSSILSVIDDLRFKLTNAENIRSRRDFNRYVIDYPSVMSANYLKKNLIVETAIYQRAYPVQKMKADSLIYQFLTDNGYNEFISENDLQPFELNVQTAERTMVDKIFALADYYMLGKTKEHSRHIYDIHKLSEIVPINETLKDLALSVARERKTNKMSPSVQDGANITDILKEIISKSVYMDDYNNITIPLLFEDVSYEKAITSLISLLNRGLF